MSLSESDFNQLIAGRQTITDAELVTAIVGVYGGVKRYTLGRLKPLILEVERRFKLIRNKKHANGKPLTFDGCTGMKEWCPKVLDYSYKQVRRMLDFKLEKDSASRAPWSTKTADGTKVLDAFSTIQKTIRRCEKPGDKFEKTAIYFTKQLYAIRWPIWKRLLILASEDVGLADISVSHEVKHLAEVAKTVKDAKHSDLLPLLEAVTICCRAKKSRAMDNACNWNTKTFVPVTAKELDAAVADETVVTVPAYAHDGLHTEKKHGTKPKAELVADFLVNEDAALGNKSAIVEVVDAVPKAETTPNEALSLADALAKAVFAYTTVGGLTTSCASVVKIRKLAEKYLAARPYNVDPESPKPTKPSKKTVGLPPEIFQSDGVPVPMGAL